MSGIQNLAFDQSEQPNHNGQNLTHRRSKQENEEQLHMTDYNTSEPVPEITMTRRSNIRRIAKIVIVNAAVATFFVFATLKYIERRDTCYIYTSCLALCSPYGMLLLVLGATYLGVLYFMIIKRFFGKTIKNSVFRPIGHMAKHAFRILWSRIIIILIVLAAFVGYIIFETHSDFSRLRALIGIVSIITIGFVFSANPRKIKWRPVVCGAIFQFLLGVFCIRWSVGRAIFECFGEKVAQFLAYSREGATFVFGSFLVEENVFAFSVLPTIFFFSLCISVLYYLEAMQWALLKLGWILQSILGTTVCESVNSAANIFLGMSEGPLIIKPYIKFLTESEIHSIMVSGFATVSGSVLAAYISFGAEPQHLITASVMAAPAGLFFSKLILPETQESKTSSDNIQMEKSADSSLLDAASNGASLGINLILNIIANLVAFVAFISFADGIFKWATTLVGFEDVGVQFVLGKIFIPVSWAIGVDWVDCEAIGNVIGTKTIINEFVAYELLGQYKRAGSISLRSSAIATYAICGFANPSSMGIMIGSLSALAPERRPTITKVAFRAFVSGCFVSLLTASIAGLLMTDDLIQGSGPRVLNDTMTLINNNTMF